MSNEQNKAMTSKARHEADLYKFLRENQSTNLPGCTGIRELAAIWYKAHKAA